MRLFNAIFVDLEHEIFLIINSVSTWIILNWSHNELVGNVSVQLVGEIVSSRKYKALVINVFRVFDNLKRAVFDEHTTRLECVYQLPAKVDTWLVAMVTSVDYNWLSAFLILHNHYAVLEIEVDSELICRQVDIPKLTGTQRNFLALDVLEQVEMSRVNLHSTHLSEYSVQSCFVLSWEQESMLINMMVELFDHFRMILLKVFLRAHCDTEEYHLSSWVHLGHLVLYFADQGIVIELIADADSLTLIECLKQMIQTCIFESRFDACDLVLTSILEFAEQRLDILTLLLGSSPE